MTGATVVRGHRHPRAGHHRDHHLGVVRPPAARWRRNRPIVEVLHFRRRRRQLHRQPLPAALPCGLAWKGGRDRRRQSRCWVFGFSEIDCGVVFPAPPLATQFAALLGTFLAASLRLPWCWRCRAVVIAAITAWALAAHPCFATPRRHRLKGSIFLSTIFSEKPVPTHGPRACFSGSCSKADFHFARKPSKIEKGEDHQHRMSQQPDDRSPELPTPRCLGARPRPRTVVAALALLFVGSRGRLVSGFLVAIARRRR